MSMQAAEYSHGWTRTSGDLQDIQLTPDSSCESVILYSKLEPY